LGFDADIAKGKKKHGENLRKPFNRNEEERKKIPQNWVVARSLLRVHMWERGKKKKEDKLIIG